MAELIAQIRIRRDTLANWAASNPVLGNGEIAFVTDGTVGSRLKVGDGVTAFSVLSFETTAPKKFVARNNAVQSIPNGAWTDVLINTEEYDELGLVLAAGKVTLQPGTYWVGGKITFASVAAAGFALQIVGTGLTAPIASDVGSQPAFTYAYRSCGGPIVVPPATTQDIWLHCYQSSGVAVNLSINESYLSIIKLA